MRVRGRARLRYLEVAPFTLWLLVTPPGLPRSAARAIGYLRGLEESLAP